MKKFDYYPFGMMMPGRKYSAEGGYRYGFNGKENDNEVKGEGNQQDYGMRIYDPRLGRFLSVDPIADEYPQLTPYQFASNQPIESIDMDGLERMDYRAIKGDDGKAKLTLVSEGPKEWKGTLLGFTINKVTIPHHIRVEYNGQHYVFDDGGRNSPVTKLPVVSGYGQYPDAVHYAADYDKFLANPDEFVKTHRSEEKEVEKWDEALRKVELAADIVEAIADGVSSGRGGRGRSPRMPRIKTPKPSTSTNKPAMQQKAAATPNTTVKQNTTTNTIVQPVSVNDLWKNAKQVPGWSKDVRKISNQGALETFESISKSMGVDSKTWKVIEGVGFSFEKGGQKVIVRKSAYDRSGAISTIEIQKSDGRGGYKQDKEIRFDHE